VNAAWNGLVNKAASATTNTYGKVTLTSPKSKARGCFNVTINTIAANGYPYNGATTRTAQVCH
jgi:hypothetical protein